MIEAAIPLDEGARILLDCEATGAVEAQVVWVLGNRFGLMFDAPIMLNTGVTERAA